MCRPRRVLAPPGVLVPGAAAWATCCRRWPSPPARRWRSACGSRPAGRRSAAASAPSSSSRSSFAAGLSVLAAFLPRAVRLGHRPAGAAPGGRPLRRRPRRSWWPWPVRRHRSASSASRRGPPMTAVVVLAVCAGLGVARDGVRTASTAATVARRRPRGLGESGSGGPDPSVPRPGDTSVAGRLATPIVARVLDGGRGGHRWVRPRPVGPGDHRDDARGVRLPDRRPDRMRRARPPRALAGGHHGGRRIPDGDGGSVSSWSGCLPASILPVTGLVRRAADRRRHFRVVVGSFVDLVVLSLAGGVGIDGALHTASQVVHDWAAQRIGRALSPARDGGDHPLGGARGAGP